MASAHNPIGIRREDKGPWERRAPVIPEDVTVFREKLGIEMIIQPSPVRIFSDDQFRRAGARVDEDLSPCTVIFGIKEIPPDHILPRKAYAFFSHTVKGQPKNMPMLRRLMETGCHLIDYERVVDDQGRRLIFFGRHAGMAGMTDTLWALGQRLNVEGIPNLFAVLKPAHAYRTTDDIRRGIAEVGRQIASTGVPAAIAPLVVGLSGYGNVSQGAQSMLDLLPIEDVTPERLVREGRAGLSNPRTVYKVVFKEEDMFVPRAPDARFDLQDYYQRPEKYASRFDDYTPLLTVLVNCIYWDSRYPRLVTKHLLEHLFGPGTTPPLRVIGDISCDVDGSVEATVKATQPDNPVYVYDVELDRAVDGFSGRGPVILAVDILPSELPWEASRYFSHVLRDYVPELAAADFSGTFAECRLSAPLKRAMILYHGELTPDYQFMKTFIQPAR